MTTQLEYIDALQNFWAGIFHKKIILLSKIPFLYKFLKDTNFAVFADNMHAMKIQSLRFTSAHIIIHKIRASDDKHKFTVTARIKDTMLPNYIIWLFSVGIQMLHSNEPLNFATFEGSFECSAFVYDTNMHAHTP